MHAVCPRLGLIDDPASSYAFPHAHNACHAVEPACPVRTEHQAALCLSGKYKTCSLYHFHIRLNSSRSVLSEEVLSRALVLQEPAARPNVAFLALLGLFLLASLSLPLLAGRLPLFSPPLSEATSTPLRIVTNTTLPTSSPVSGLPASTPPLSPTSQPARATTTPPSSPTHPLSHSPSPPLPSDVFVAAPTAPQLPSSQATSSSPLPCSPPPGWVTYTIRPGDTLFRLALATGTTVEQIRTANCLPAGAILSIGQQIYLPRRPSVAPGPTNTRPPPTAPVAAPPTQPPPSATPVPPPATPPPTATSLPPSPRSTPTSAPTLEG